MADLFGNNFRTLESTLIAREKLQNAISGNIANVDTPNHGVDSREFSDFLAAEQQRGGTDHLAATQPGHFRDAPSSSASSTSLFHANRSQRIDGNSVDLQKEMARMAENQLMHDMANTMLKRNMTGLLNAIKEGNR